MNIAPALIRQFQDRWAADEPSTVILAWMNANGWQAVSPSTVRKRAQQFRGKGFFFKHRDARLVSSNSARPSARKPPKTEIRLCMHCKKPYSYDPILEPHVRRCRSCKRAEDSASDWMNATLT